MMIESLFESNVCFHSVNIFIFLGDKVIFKWQAKICVSYWWEPIVMVKLTGAFEIALYFLLHVLPTEAARDHAHCTPQAIYCSLIRFNLIKEICIASHRLQSRSDEGEEENWYRSFMHSSWADDTLKPKSTTNYETSYLIQLNRTRRTKATQFIQNIPRVEFN